MAVPSVSRKETPLDQMVRGVQSSSARSARTNARAAWTPWDTQRLGEYKAYIAAGEAREGHAGAQKDWGGGSGQRAQAAGPDNPRSIG